MRWLFIIMTGMMLTSINAGYSEDIGLATYQEIAQVLVDGAISQNITASITLQSTSVQELKIPASLEQRIRDDSRIEAVILTNEEQCVLGVMDEACMLINVKRDPGDANFPAIQDTTKSAAAPYIDELNSVFGIDSEFHSVFIHTSSRTNEMLGTSGIVSGKGTISAVYTMPQESADSMYEKISTMLLAKEIRESGGFYDVARNLAQQDGARMTFSILPLDDRSLLQLKITAEYPEIATKSEISPLEYLQVGTLERSEYFASGFYPLNSLLQVIVLSPDTVSASDVNGDILETIRVDGDLVPTDISAEGWVFDPQEGPKIQGTWIFGKEAAVDADTVVFSLNGQGGTSPSQPDESAMVAIIIAVVAAVAVVFYMKGYRR